MNNGIIYFIQPAELIDTNRFKIGCSSKPNLNRLQNGYKSDSRFLCVMECFDPFSLEKIIIDAFKNKFLLIAGNEYFCGNESDMLDMFIDLTIKYKKNNLQKSVKIEDRFQFFLSDIKTLIDCNKDEYSDLKLLLNSVASDSNNRNIIYTSICNNESFKKIILNLNENDLNSKKNIYSHFFNNCVLFNQIDTMFLIEKYLNIQRFQINDVGDIDVSDAKIYLHAIIENLYFIFINDEWKNKTIKNLKLKINKLQSINHVQKFIADCYNHISNKSVLIKRKRIVKKNNIKITFYHF